MRKRRSLNNFPKLPLCLFLWCIGVLLSMDAQAELVDVVNPEEVCALTDVDGNFIDLDGNPSVDPVNPTGLTNRIITCIENILQRLAAEHFDTVQEPLRDIIAVVLVLYLVFFASRVVMQGVRSPKAELFFSIFGIAAVIYFTMETGVKDFHGVFFATQRASVDAVTESISNPSGPAVIDCSTYPPGHPLEGQRYGVWQRVDCVIAYFMGAQMLTGEDPSADAFGDDWQDVISFAPFLLAIGLLFTGLGPFILMVVLAIPIMAISAFGQAMMVYISSLLALTFLGLVAPIIIPLVLFKVTRRIFLQWAQMLISYMLIPTFILGYLTFMVHVVNYVIGGPGGLLNIFEVVGLKHEVADDSERNNSTVFTMSSFAQACTSTEGGGSGEDIVCEPPDPDAIDEGGTGTETAQAFLPYADWGGTPEEKRDNILDLIMALLGLLVTILVTKSFMDNVLQFGAKLVGITAGQIGANINVYNIAQSAVKAAATGKPN